MVSHADWFKWNSLGQAKTDIKIDSESKSTNVFFCLLGKTQKKSRNDPYIKSKGTVFISRKHKIQETL